MNTLVLNKNINFEEYQQIVDYFATIGIEVTNPYEYPSLITDEDREAIALAREDVKNGNWIDGGELFEIIRKKYASKMVG
ncbi:hypothetical protein JMN11_00965 [Capnocytophaga genosp. AHN8471]|jgi:hypothetical protein|uniref:hypothetical protein n=1 Tax=Capnocytophaga TaxID=1016 RepID=UPI0002A22CDD|nr:MULTISPECIES: hypothetical protein [Capnocytophaga]EKY11847.1 hypothetical protein HMPREF9073_02930 [Capnocytophaga sp. oral taxon 326 str. F0382]MBM0652261.1 hypothetical protein [Capnocytophaga genosp. AHN8471]MBM0659156.1 hypothetical protein [Capnocytophaga genosp. AHN8471]